MNSSKQIDLLLVKIRVYVYFTIKSIEASNDINQKSGGIKSYGFFQGGIIELFQIINLLISKYREKED